MEKGPDGVLGELAVAERLLSRDELLACLDAQRLGGGARPLGHVMVDMQLVSPEDLDRLLAIQKKKLSEDKPLPHTIAELFGRLAAGKGYVSLEKVEECLAEQKHLENQGQEMRLGQIMVRKRYLTAEQFIEVLKMQEQMVRTCGGCGKTMVVGENQPDAACRHCGKAFESRAKASSRFIPPEPVKKDPARSTPVSDHSGGPETEATLRRPSLHAEIRAASSHPKSTRGGSSSHLTPLAGAPDGKGFGRYKLIESIGVGGMGTVYKALDVPLNRLVALKLLRASEVPDASYVMRFIRQAKTAARLNHPSIITIHEVGTIEDAQYFTMEYIDGAPLDRLLGDGKITRAQALEIMEKVARAIDYAHSCGVIHGNLKPANVMVDRQNQPHITDFGMARESGSQDGMAAVVPYYMAPEQIRPDSEPIDARTDIYSIGVMLYEILAGDIPFPGDTLAEVHQKILTEDPIRPLDRNPEVSPGLETICLKAMEKDPRRRYSSSLELAEDMRRHLKGEPIAARPASVWMRATRRFRRHRTAVTLSILVAGLLVAGGLMFLRHQRDARRAEDARLKKDQRDRAQPKFDDAARGADKFLREQRPMSADEYRLLAERHLKAVGEALEIDPGFAEAMALRARVLAAQGRLPEAEKELSAAAAAEPASPVPDFEMGRLMWRQFLLLRGRPLAYAGLAGEILTVPDAESDAAKKYREGAAVYFRAYLDKIDKLEDKVLKNEERPFAKAVIAFVEQHHEEMLEQAAEMQRMFGGPREEIALLKSAAHTLPKGKIEEIYKNFDHAVRCRPVQSDGLFGTTPFNKVEIEWAAGIIDAEIGRGPKPHLYVHRGLLRQLLGNRKGAREDFSLASEGALPEGRERLFYVELAENRPAEATGILEQYRGDAAKVAILKAALESIKPVANADGVRRFFDAAQDALTRNPRDPYALYLRGRARLNQDDRDGALRDASDALKTLVNFHQAYELRAQAKVRLKDTLGAQDDIRHCKELRKDYELVYVTGCALFQGDSKWPELKAEAENGLKLFPKNFELKLFRAKALFQIDLKEASVALKECVAEDPNHVEAALYHGMILIRLGKPEEGWRELDRISRANPTNYQVYEFIGTRRYNLRQWPEAKVQFELALKYCPENLRVTYRRILDDVEGKLVPQWRTLLDVANSLVIPPRPPGGGAPPPPDYAQANREFKRAFELYDKRKPEDALTQKDKQTIMVCTYNYACTFSFLSKDAGDKKAEFESKALEWLERAMMSGFDRNVSEPHDDIKERHTGLQHITHDTDFDPIRGLDDFKKLVEKFEKTPSPREEF